MSVRALQKVFDVSLFPQPLREHSSLGQTLCAVEGLHRLIGERVATANRLDALGAHKQIVNRVLEPFSHISVVVTSTEWDNFFALRRREDADPIMQALADAMREAMKASSPRSLVEGEFHAPYLPGGVGRSEEEARVCAACCARVSAREQGLEAARMRCPRPRPRVSSQAAIHPFTQHMDALLGLYICKSRWRLRISARVNAWSEGALSVNTLGRAVVDPGSGPWSEQLALGPKR